MRKNGAEPVREIDFSRAKRGPVARPEPGKTKISIRLDNAVLDYFRAQADEAGGGNYQSLINEALRAYIRHDAMVDTLRDVVKQEVSGPLEKLRSSLAPTRKRSRSAA